MCCCLLSCKRESEGSGQKHALPAEVICLDSLSTSVTHNYVGEVEEAVSLPLSLPLGGKIASICVSKNERVKAGQVLLVVDSVQQHNALLSARATLRQAKDGYDRLHQVHTQGAVADVKWVEIQTQLQRAEAMLAAAQKNLDDCVLRAPQAGVVSELNVHVGQQLAPAQPALRLINVSGVNIAFSVPESEIASINISDEATIIVPALADEQFVGKVTEKELVANRLSHSYKVRVALPNNEGRCMPGMMCKVRLKAQEQKGFVLPADCITTTDKGAAVWVIVGGKAHRVIISAIGFTNDGVLVSGLQKGDSVVVKGYSNLYENAEVTVSSYSDK